MAVVSSGDPGRLTMTRCFHGQAGQLTRTKKYITWCKLVTRCTNPNSLSFPTHVGKLHATWRSFNAFHADVPDPPDQPCRLTRLNKKGNFTPDNVVWKIVGKPKTTT